MTKGLKLKTIKANALIAVLLGAINFDIVSVFAQAGKVADAFKSAQNTGSTFNTTEVTNFTGNFVSWVQAWMDGLGNVVPILTVTMIIVGIVLSLITSFSRRTRGFGLGMAIFALGVFLLWLFLPTIIQWFYQ